MSLTSAVKSNDLLSFQKALVDKSNLNETDEFGWSALHYTFALGYVAMTKALIENGASLSLKSREGDTPVEIGLIFKQMGCLALVKTQLMHHPEYQLLQQFEENWKKTKAEKHGAQRYAAACELAIHYVCTIKKIQASNPVGVVDKALDKKMDEEYDRYKNVSYIFISLMHEDRLHFFYTYVGEKSKLGNCGTQSSIAYLLCKHVFGLRKVDQFGIYGVDHLALVLGRADESGSHYTTWGKNAVVCDPWRGKVYSAAQIPEELFKNINVIFHYAAGITFLNPNYCFEFPTQERIKLSIPPESNHLLAQYYYSRKGLTKQDKILALRKLQALHPDDRHIPEVIAHKLQCK